MKCPQCGADNTEVSNHCSRCSSPLKLQAENPESLTQTIVMEEESIRSGSLFANRYKIQEELGKGGMGQVFKVYDTELEEMVALKLLSGEVSRDKETIARFRNELKLARKITHKNICRMYDLSYQEGQPFITMEYVSGETLKSTIKRIGVFPAGKSVSLAIQICEGLKAAHDLGITHRDLKPENIMIDTEGNARIMDFGIARSSRDIGMTGQHAIIGTPQYMSPEQTEGQSLDNRSDIYSLGLILFEMLTGAPPFTGNSPIDVMIKQRTEAPPEPRDKNPTVPPELNGLILHCLDKDRENRFQSVSEILSELKEVERTFSTTELNLGKKDSSRKGKSAQWKQFRLQGALSLLFILMAATLLFWLFKGKSLPPSESGIGTTVGLPSWTDSIAVLPFQNMSPEPDQEYFCDGLTEQLISNLAHIRTLKVPARTSIMAYKNEARDIRQIAQELGVARILEGSVRKSGDRIRISAQLIDVKTNDHLWAQDYDRRLDDIFIIQDEVSQAIASALKLQLSPETLSRMKTPEGDVEAYDLYLKARHIIHERYLKTHIEEDFQQALETAELAVSIDQDYASGYLLLAYLYEVHMVVTGNTQERDRQKQYLDEAYSLDPNLAEANAGIGYIYVLKDEFDAAFPFIKRGIAINPNNYTACHLTGMFFARLSMYEMAIEFYSRAVDLDRNAFFSIGNRGICYLNIGNFSKARDDLEKSLAIQENVPVYLHSLALVHIFENNFGQADELLKKAERAGQGDPGAQWYRAVYYAAQGDKERALSAQKNAAVFSLLGMKREALSRMPDEQKKYPWFYDYAALNSFPLYEELRGEPEFQDMILRQKAVLEQNIRRYDLSGLD